MTTVNRKVIDLSHWNTVSNLQQVKDAGIIGVIHKATEGTYYRDDKYNARRDGFLELGLEWGAYHFANAEDPIRQADYFLDFAGRDDAFLYALDWEDYGSNTMSLDNARRFMEEIDSQMGENRCVMYSGNRAKEALGNTDDAFMGAHRLWLAQYSSTPVAQASWDTIWLWQYSDGANGPNPHDCPGVNGDCDTNSWNGSDEELRAQWSGLALPERPPIEDRPPPPAFISMEITSTVPAIIMVNGRLIVPRDE